MGQEQYFKVSLMLMIKHFYSDFTKPLQGNIQLIAVGHHTSIRFVFYYSKKFIWHRHGLDFAQIFLAMG